MLFFRHAMMSALVLICIGLAIQDAGAQDQEKAENQCGTILKVAMEVEPLEFCDIHSRRLAYHEETIAFRKTLDERRENYQRPRTAAKQAYEEAVRNLDR